LLFIRNPRALDTPLPTGVSCRQGVACGAISLRRLPPPVAHVALDFAGFDPTRFGMLGKVRQDGDGFTVVLPRQAYRVERGGARPVAIPVTPLASLGMRATRLHRIDSGSFFQRPARSATTRRRLSSSDSASRFCSRRFTRVGRRCRVRRPSVATMNAG
jgi:hypothetical protein